MRQKVARDTSMADSTPPMGSRLDTHFSQSSCLRALRGGVFVTARQSIRRGRSRLSRRVAPGQIAYAVAAAHVAMVTVTLDPLSFAGVRGTSQLPALAAVSHVIASRPLVRPQRRCRCDTRQDGIRRIRCQECFALTRKKLI
jgi:hypothetical protein